MAGSTPPPLSAADKAKLKDKGTQNALDTDPYNLDVSGYGRLSGVPIQGAWELFGLPTTQPIPPPQNNQQIFGQIFRYPTPTRAPLTATETLQAFEHMTGPGLANIQSQLFRAGFYGGNFIPTYGQLRAEDISAFRSMLIGVASNPSASSIGDYLSAAAQAGDQQGVNTRKRNPLVVKLTNEDDLRAVLQSGTQAVFGKYLSEDDVQKFVNTYHAQETAAQTAAYAASGYNPNTGQQDLSGMGGTGGTVTGPPTDQAGINLALAQQMYKDHPVTAEMAQFVNAFDSLKKTLGERLPGGGVG